MSYYYNFNPASPEAQHRRDPAINQQMSNRMRLKNGFICSAGFVIVIWVVFFLEILSGGELAQYGVHPRDVSSLWQIFTSPLLHANLSHITGNTVPGAIFAFLIGLSGKRVFVEVTLIATIVGGLGTWVFGGIGTNHIGASGVIYGWLGYLIIRGFFNRDGRQIALGAILAIAYSGLFWGMLPLQPGVSWQGHLFGALGGALAGAFITSDDPEELKVRRAQKKLEKRQRRLGS